MCKCVLDPHPSNVLACEMGGSAEGTKDDVKRPKGPPTRSRGLESPYTSSKKNYRNNIEMLAQPGQLYRRDLF